MIYIVRPKKKLLWIWNSRLDKTCSSRFWFCLSSLPRTFWVMYSMLLPWEVMLILYEHISTHSQCGIFFSYLFLRARNLLQDWCSKRLRIGKSRPKFWQWIFLNVVAFRRYETRSYHVLDILNYHLDKCLQFPRSYSKHDLQLNWALGKSVRLILRFYWNPWEAFTSSKS